MVRTFPVALPSYWVGPSSDCDPSPGCPQAKKAAASAKRLAKLKGAGARVAAAKAAAKAKAVEELKEAAVGAAEIARVEAAAEAARLEAAREIAEAKAAVQVCADEENAPSFQALCGAQFLSFDRRLWTSRGSESCADRIERRASNSRERPRWAHSAL